MRPLYHTLRDIQAEMAILPLQLCIKIVILAGEETEILIDRDGEWEYQ